MKTLLITIRFTDDTGKWWWDCGLKNVKVDFDPDKQNIHKVIKDMCENEGMELSYKGKPRGNVFHDLKDGGVEICGYIYRGKGEVHDRNMVRPVMVLWDIWVTIEMIEKFEFVEF